MSKKILFVCPFQNAEAKKFVESLAGGLVHLTPKIKDANVGSFWFDPSNYDLVHYFLPASAPLLTRTIRKGAQTKIVQTIINEGPGLNKSIFADAVVTFSDQQRHTINQKKQVKSITILPCLRMDEGKRGTPVSIREKYSVNDRLLAVALNDFKDQQHFSAFLYTAREYQRRGGFRFLLPLYSKDRQSLTWRSKLQHSITHERLSATTLVDESADLHSLIGASDLTLLIDKRTDREFGFPLAAIESISAGKPLIAFDVSPVNEIVAAFQNDWIARAYEDFSRISRDLARQAPELEQISTEFARFARTKMSIESVSQQHEQLYNSLLSL